MPIAAIIEWKIRHVRRGIVRLRSHAPQKKDNAARTSSRRVIVQEGDED